ncbi:MAG: Glu-tRNA(Gln) amidotransferase GatDE subunit E, partial [candidate division Zixibacteria bacterium]|nr:Glu-tRNA(Gln) amidotransferase GatDE subunit E [candidate division Zixibacteria bacterium]
KNESACTYDIDDTPPFPINRKALAIAVEIALLLKTKIVGELHITRKQYLDGSIPTGFQRTAIVGIEGDIPLASKKVRIIQLSIEEDSCREVSDIGHVRVYTTDRLGIPLIETVTYPDMLTPDEAAAAGHYLRFLARSSGKVRSGIGAARQDVNVSINGGTRVEIKGVAHISWIPELTHNEAFRQKALLDIRSELKSRVPAVDKWQIASASVDHQLASSDHADLKDAIARGYRVMAVNLPYFGGVLSFFTQPEKMFADEISGRLKVIACLEQPNMIHSESLEPALNEAEWDSIKRLLHASDRDAQIILWGPHEDIPTALETIEERCRLAFAGVPNETRKSLPNGTTIFERVLPGPNRMYPDTDSAPIPLKEEFIEECGQDLPLAVSQRLQQLQEWRIPADCYHYLLRRNLVPMIEKIVAETGEEARFVGTLFGHTLKSIEGRHTPTANFSYNKVYGLFKFVRQRGLERNIVREMLPVIYSYSNMEFDSILTTIGYRKLTTESILSHIPILRRMFSEIRVSSSRQAEVDWIMGSLRGMAIGNMLLRELKAAVAAECA